jgi:hypothetical protein
MTDVDGASVLAVGPAVHAVGWATVDLDRAADELRPLLLAGASFVTAPDSELLGARCRVGPFGGSPGADAAAGAAGPPVRAWFLVLVEPTTEGRLAATLARHGEGWCATWTTAESADPRATSGPRSVVRDGPFGRERLAIDGPVSGPHHLWVEPATIDA